MPSEITGLILAGGQGRRMGGCNKGLLPFRGRPLFLWVMEGLAPQVGEVLVSANQDIAAYAGAALPVVEDVHPGCGPLAGLHAGLLASPTSWLATAPCDAPYFPNNWVARLYEAASAAGSKMAIACVGERQHPVFSVCHTDLADALEQFLCSGERRMTHWCRQQEAVCVDFGGLVTASEEAGLFANLNTPEDFALLERGPCLR